MFLPRKVCREEGHYGSQSKPSCAANPRGISRRHVRRVSVSVFQFETSTLQWDDFHTWRASPESKVA
jgi:hypothetical protein